MMGTQHQSSRRPVGFSVFFLQELGKRFEVRIGMQAPRDENQMLQLGEVWGEGMRHATRITPPKTDIFPDN